MGKKSHRPNVGGKKPTPQPGQIFATSTQIMSVFKATSLLKPKFTLRVARRLCGFRWWRSQSEAHQRASERECARRVRQMARGMNCGQRNFA